jgi:Helix-turn-helix domain of resolvase
MIEPEIASEGPKAKPFRPRNRWFESGSLQRGISCELTFGRTFQLLLQRGCASVVNRRLNMSTSGQRCRTLDRVDRARGLAVRPSRRCVAADGIRRPRSGPRWSFSLSARTGEGRERAKARGVKMGRKPKLTPHQQAEAIKRRDAGEPMREIGKSFNVSHSTISRLGHD